MACRKKDDFAKPWAIKKNASQFLLNTPPTQQKTPTHPFLIRSKKIPGNFLVVY